MNVAVSSSDKRNLAAALVAGQLLLLGTQALLRRRSRQPDWPRPPIVRVAAAALAVGGGAIVVAGSGALGRGLTASPLPNERAQLRTDGPYGRVRHPIYSGVIALSLARTLDSQDGRQAVLTTALVLLLRVKSAFEEAALRHRFDDYPSYAAMTPRFIPRVRQPSP